MPPFRHRRQAPHTGAPLSALTRSWSRPDLRATLWWQRLHRCRQAGHPQVRPQVLRGERGPLAASSSLLPPAGRSSRSTLPTSCAEFTSSSDCLVRHRAQPPEASWQPAVGSAGARGGLARLGDPDALRVPAMQQTLTSYMLTK